MNLFCMSQELESLLTRYENGNKENLVTLVNKSPSWNEPFGLVGVPLVALWMKRSLI